MFGPTPTSGCARIMCSPSRIIATRSSTVGSFMSKIDASRRLISPGAAANTSAATIGRTARRRRSLNDRSSAAAAQAPTDALRVNVRMTAHDERRHHEGGPEAIARAEQDARERGAHDEHQQPRERHVVAERSPRAVIDAVVQDAVLKDPDRGARRSDRDDERDHRGSAIAGGESKHERDEQEQDELLAVHDARRALGRKCGGHERGRAVCQERPEKSRDADPLTARDRRARASRAIAMASSDCATAMENCTVAATPRTASRPPCSSQSMRAASGGAELRACALVIVTLGILTARSS